MTSRLQRLTFPRCLLTGLVCLCLADELGGQTTRATLTGTVTDPAGAVVEGAKVTATNVATNVAASRRPTTPASTSLPRSRPASTCSKSNVMDSSGTCSRG